MLIARALDGGRYEWRTMVNDEASQGVRQGLASELVFAAAGKPVRVVMTGAALRIATLKIPGKSERVVKQAARFAVEDELAEDLDEVEVTCGPALANGERPVAIVSRAALESVVAPLKSAGATLQDLTADYLLLPWRENTWSLCAAGNTVLVRTGRQQGFAVEPPLLSTVIEKLLSQMQPERLLVIGEVELPIAARGIPRDSQSPHASILEYAAEHDSRAMGLNLLPAAYQANANAPTRSRWLAVALFLLALGIDLGWTWRDNANLAHQIAVAEQTQSDLIKRAFPEITRVVSPEVQAQQVLTNLRHDANQQMSMLALLHELGRALQNPAASGASINAINFAGGVMTVQINVSDMTKLEQLSVVLGTFLKVDVVSVDSSGKEVHGSLRLEPLSKATS